MMEWEYALWTFDEISGKDWGVQWELGRGHRVSEQAW